MRMSHRMVHRRHPAIATPGVRRRGGSALGGRGGTTVAELLATVAVLGTFVSTTVLTTSQVRPLYIIRGAARQVADDVERPHLRSEEHTSELQSRRDLVCRLLLEKKKKKTHLKRNK